MIFEYNKDNTKEDNYYCENCNYKCKYLSNWNKHISTQKHINHYKSQKKEETFNEIINKKKYECIYCNYNCSKKNNYEKHLLTTKHKDNEKKYNNAINKESSENETKMLRNIVKDLIQQNEGFMNTIVNENNELRKIIENKSLVTQNNIQNNIQNIQNKFNLNIFLNEQCKDAFNISEYIENIKLSLNDLEQTARLGYTDGITKIIKDRIQETGLMKRPFHCTDVKREVVYVKENDVWEKENYDKPRMKKMISNVIQKNFQQLSNWQEKYPESSDLSTQKGEEYLNIMIQVNGGDQNERERKEEKILKNILKEVIVEKI